MARMPAPMGIPNVFPSAQNGVMGRHPARAAPAAEREFRRPTDRSGQGTTFPPVPLLAMQQAAGNPAVTALIAGNATPPGTLAVPVQRQPPPDSRPAGPSPRTADPKNLASPASNLAPTGLMYQDPEPAPPEHRGGDTWNLEFQMYGKPQAFTGLDDEGVIKKLQGFYFALLDDMKNGQQAQEHWREEMGSSFGTRWAAGASMAVADLTDPIDFEAIAKGSAAKPSGDWPDPGQWLEVDRQIFGAFLMLRESLWAVMSARNERLDAGARAQAKPLTEKRMNEVVAILEKGDVAAAKAWDDWKRFLDKSERGAARALTGLKVAKVAGAVAIAYLTAGAAAEAQLGYWGTSTALAATGGTYAAGQNLAEQGGEMLFGDRDHIDWGSVAKAGVVNAAASFVGGVIGGKFAGILSNSLGKMVGGLSPELMQTFGIRGAQLLTNAERIFVQWLGNVVSSPFQTSITVLMQSALNRKWSVTSTGDFLDMVLHDLVLNGSIGGFFSLVHAQGPAAEAPPRGQESRGTGDGGGTGGAGGGPAGGGAPPGRPTLRGMGAAGPAGENAPPRIRTGETLTGMGAAGPAGENAPPGPRPSETLTGMGAAGPAGQNASPAIRPTRTPTRMDPAGAAAAGRRAAAGIAGRTPSPGSKPPAAEIEMPAEYVGRRPLVTEHAELTSPIERSPDNRMSVSGFPGSLPPGYGVFRKSVQLPTGEVVDAVVKIYPGERAPQYAKEVAGAMAAARTGLGPRFYGRVPIATDPRYARPGQPDLAFAMEPVEGAFAHPGIEPGDPGYAAAAAESAQAAGRINGQTFRDVRDFADAVLDQGYAYGGAGGGEVQGLIGPGGRWKPIDFQGLSPLPTDPTLRAEALTEHAMWVQDEINNLQKARDDHNGFADEDPTDPGR